MFANQMSDLKKLRRLPMMLSGISMSKITGCFGGKGFSTLFGYDPDSLTPTLDLLVDFPFTRMIGEKVGQ